MIPTDFRTRIIPPPITKQLNFGEEVVLIGSCFSENIGRKLKEGGFPTLLNPFGILFNPASISTALNRTTSMNLYDENELILNEGKFHSLDHHGSFSSEDASKMLQRINANIKEGHTWLTKASLLTISLGTANVYNYKEENKIVANCHKIPANRFSKEQLSKEDIFGSLSKAIANLSQINKELTVLITVSPVRYLRDGLVNDRLSKSTLILAAHELANKFKNCHYFPSYELINDDLRDYRFYADDMIHPSEMAVNYIWEAFKASVLNKDALNTVQEVEDLFKAVSHRPIEPNSEATIKFNLKLLEKIEEMEQRHPKIDIQHHRQVLSKKESL